MGRILLAGTDAAALDILANEIIGEGHEVIEASDGDEAYDRVLNEFPDLVVLEPSMPVFDGYETCERLRADPDVAPALPIVFLVGQDVDTRRLERVGVTDTLGIVHDAFEVTDLLTKHLSADAL